MQEIFYNKIRKYVPPFVDVVSGDGIYGILRSVALMLSNTYTHVLTLSASENTGKGLKIKAEEDHIYLSGRETEAESRSLLTERFNTAKERGTINGIIKDVGVITYNQIGKVVSVDATNQSAVTTTSDFDMKSASLLLNSSFNDGSLDSCPSNWISPTNNVTKTAAEHYAGLYSMKMDVPASGQCKVYQDILAKPDIMYTLSLAHKIGSGKAVTCRVIRCKGYETGATIELTSLILTGTGSWETELLHFVYPKTEDDTIRIQFDAADDAFTAYIDEVILQEDYEFTIGLWVSVSDTLTGNNIIFHKAESEVGKGYGLIASDFSGQLHLSFKLNDGNNTDEVTYDSIFKEPNYNCMHLVVISVGQSKIKIIVDNITRQEIDRTVYGDYRSANSLTFFKDSSANSGYLKGLVGDIQILIDHYDTDNSISEEWYTRGMSIHPAAIALWRWGLYNGQDQTQNSNNLLLSNLNNDNIRKLSSKVPNNGYPSYPAYKSYYNDKYANSVSIGLWAGRTFIGSDNILIGTDAIIEIELDNFGRLTEQQINKIIREKILPIDVQLAGKNTVYNTIATPEQGTTPIIPPEIEQSPLFDRSTFDETTIDA